MKVIIAGSRNIFDRELLERAIKTSNFNITEVVCGMAKGADTLGLEWAKENDIPVTEFPADWKKHGRAAGPIRNEEMVGYADALILLWDGKSKGSKSTFHLADMYRLPMHVVYVKDKE